MHTLRNLLLASALFASAAHAQTTGPFTRDEESPLTTRATGTFDVTPRPSRLGPS